MKWNGWVLALAVMLFAATVAEADYAADYYYVAPSKSAAAAALSASEVAALLAQPCPHHRFSEFAGKNDLLAETPSKYEALCVAKNFAIGLDESALFPLSPVSLQPARFLASVESEGAYALRLLVDLSGLKAREALYLIDAEVGAVFGPYTREDALEEGRWLPTVQGDTVHCLVESASESRPALRLIKAAHFYRELNPPIAKAYPCPIPVACPEDSAFQEVSTGVGMLLLSSDVGTYQCTGSLLNVPSTAALESYLITANHCFPDGVTAQQIEVVWDYRSTACSGGSTPNISTLPRSYGESILALDALSDGAFIRLSGEAPNGDYGRAWLGWDTYSASVGAAISGIHHPAGASMKAAFGSVVDTDVTACLDSYCLNRVYHQIGVLWSEGITQGGSSGSPLLFSNRSYRVCGMLSNGAVHDCDNPAQNYDNYANFSEFFQYIACYLDPSLTCKPVEGGSSDGGCLAKALYGADSLMVDKLRTFRDKALARFALGRQLTQAYYALAPEMIMLARNEPFVRNGVRVLASSCALCGAWCER